VDDDKCGTNRRPPSLGGKAQGFLNQVRHGLCRRALVYPKQYRWLLGLAEDARVEMAQ
jgi:hypothetical protein